MTDAHSSAPLTIPTVRLMVDYAAAMPLWTADEGAAAAIEQLPERIRLELRQWSEGFQRSYDHVLGWPSRKVLRDHLAKGWSLREDVQAVLEDYIVYYDVWETTVRTSTAR